jgi:hypothetical protein
MDWLVRQPLGTAGPKLDACYPCDRGALDHGYLADAPMRCRLVFGPSCLKVLARIGLVIWSPAMRHLHFLALVISVCAWSQCQAAGSFQKPEPKVEKAGMPAITVPSITSSDFGGCGRGRVRDPRTHGCRGPADIR